MARDNSNYVRAGLRTGHAVRARAWGAGHKLCAVGAAVGPPRAPVCACVPRTYVRPVVVVFVRASEAGKRRGEGGARWDRARRVGHHVRASLAVVVPSSG